MGSGGSRPNRVLRGEKHIEWGKEIIKKFKDKISSKSPSPKETIKLGIIDEYKSIFDNQTSPEALASWLWRVARPEYKFNPKIAVQRKKTPENIFVKSNFIVSTQTANGDGVFGFETEEEVKDFIGKSMLTNFKVFKLIPAKVSYNISLG